MRTYCNVMFAHATEKSARQTHSLRQSQSPWRQCFRIASVHSGDSAYCMSIFFPSDSIAPLLTLINRETLQYKRTLNEKSNSTILQSKANETRSQATRPFNGYTKMNSQIHKLTTLNNQRCPILYFIHQLSTQLYPILRTKRSPRCIIILT